MHPTRALTWLMLFTPALAAADLERLVPEATLGAIAHEVSGVSAKRNLDTITLYHRTRASSQYRAAAEHIRGKLVEYGFANAEILEYPADGVTMFGTQKSRPAWEVEFAELWELDAGGQRARRHGSWEALPLSLAQDSVAGVATAAALVDIGAGTTDADYAGKNLAGKLALTFSQPEAVAERAVGQLGAAGIVSYAPNQVTAWWKEDDRLVRWGHLDSFSPVKTFAFMVSLGVARNWQARLAAGETIRFDAEVRARQETGRYALVTAVLPGTDLAAEEIVYTCHLDHPRPGANDNASGCVGILEAARTLKRLVDDGALTAPRRSLRFVWPAEIEGTLIYLASMKDTSHIKANVHLDMVGGNAETKSVFRISGGPMSLPTFIADVGHEIGRYVNDQTERYASGETVAYPLVSVEGSKNPQLGLLEGISMGSDHNVYQAGSFRIPGIYLHDWPDRYIHTNFDSAAMIDPTKLKRAAFIAAVQGWYLANFGTDDVEPALELLRANALERLRNASLDLQRLPASDRPAAMQAIMDAERGKVASISEFALLNDGQNAYAAAYVDRLAALQPLPALAIERATEHPRVYQRNPEVRGTMFAFGYNYLRDHLAADAYAALKLAGPQAYEALNLVNGQRTVDDIHAWLQAEFGPVALQDVADYLAALESIEVLR